jgi:predicted RNA-binding Zn ribbon-like protein
MASDPAPGELELVRAFVNSRHEDEEDELGSPEALQAWLQGHGLLGADAGPVTGADREHAIGVREALRALMLANAGGPLDPAAPRLLEDAARRADLGLRFRSDGAVQIAPSAPGVDGALGAILARAVSAMSAGTWARLKACGEETCRWAFYDHTKNGSGVWCDMAVCGNRAKARAYRRRHAGD